MITQYIEPSATTSESQRFGDATKKAKVRLRSKSASDQDKIDAQMIIDKVEETAAKKLKYAEQLVESKKYGEAIMLLKEVSIRFKGTDAEKTAKERIKELSKDPDVKKELAAARILQRLIVEADKTRGTVAKQRIAAYLDAFAKKYAGTQAAVQATEKAEEVRNSR